MIEVPIVGPMARWDKGSEAIEHPLEALAPLSPGIMRTRAVANATVDRQDWPDGDQTRRRDSEAARR
jgi:hypothetical protein